jgi:polyisoprenoid-binding protein YceI
MTQSAKSVRWMMAGLLPLMLGARSLNDGGMDMQAESRLWVGGTSSVRGWECKATTFTATITSAPNAAATVLAGEKAVDAVELIAPVDKLECGNGQMNGHMRKALKAEEHGQIAFRMTSYELARSNDALAVTIDGSLTLGGTEKPIQLTGTAVPAGEGALRISGTYSLKMTDFALKPPTLMFGRIKVHDLVKVGFDIVLKDRTQ